MKITILNQHSMNVGDDAAGISVIQQIIDIVGSCDIHVIYNGHIQVGLPVQGDMIHHHFLPFNKRDLLMVCLYLVKRGFGSRAKDGVIFETIKVIEGSDIVLVSPCGANIGLYKDWFFLLRLLIAVIEVIHPFFV